MVDTSHCVSIFCLPDATCMMLPDVNAHDEIFTFHILLPEAIKILETVKAKEGG